MINSCALDFLLKSTGHKTTLLEIGADLNIPVLIRRAFEQIAQERDGFTSAGVNAFEPGAQFCDSFRYAEVRQDAAEFIAALSQEANF